MASNAKQLQDRLQYQFSDPQLLTLALSHRSCGSNNNERLEFLGDAISLKGNGEMDFDQNLDLQFYTAVGRDGFRIPLLSPLLGAASQQILVIDVTGKTHNPKIKKNFFKMLNQKLKEWESTLPKNPSPDCFSEERKSLK